MTITPVYAALLGLLFLLLSLLTIRQRRLCKVGVGDGGQPALTRAMRVHANFAEYVPLCLILLLVLESRGAPAWALHALGLCLVLGRLLHAYGVSQLREKLQFRISGMLLTFVVLIVAPVWILVGYL